ncbi:hypothetical protein DB345_17550 [Spartobacteria bacterium LR76]|nr:hypothetical protein DB345_17550 [Spartobacteria bacterium LR76]
MKAFLRVLCCLVLVAGAARADQVVADVQKKLLKMGYYNGVVDGQMGSQTSAAIRRYQLAENLRVTGNLTPQTLDRLHVQVPSPVAQATPPPKKPAYSQPKPATVQAVPEYVAIADIFKGGPYIMAGPEVQIATIRQAQKTLRLLGYYNGPVNGSPSPALVSALKAWQASARFRQTGRFDENTLKGLNIMPN